MSRRQKMSNRKVLENITIKLVYTPKVRQSIVKIKPIRNKNVVDIKHDHKQIVIYIDGVEMVTIYKPKICNMYYTNNKDELAYTIWCPYNENPWAVPKMADIILNTDTCLFRAKVAVYKFSNPTNMMNIGLQYAKIVKAYLDKRDCNRLKEEQYRKKQAEMVCRANSDIDQLLSLLSQLKV